MLRTGTMVIDPVCGMTIDRDDSIEAEHEETTYYFCDPACLSIFREEPARWIDDHGHRIVEHGTVEHEH